jgi:hypothetical protein
LGLAVTLVDAKNLKREDETCLKRECHK